MLVAGAAAGQTRTPDDYTSPEEMARFQTCRAAVFYHLDGPADPAARVPRPVARALLDQINFIMSEALLAKYPGDVDGGLALLQSAERFFLGFSRAIAEQRPALSDAGARDTILLDCIPAIWATTRLFIDDLARWRRATIPAPPQRDPAAAQALLDSLTRRFSGAP